MSGIYIGGYPNSWISYTLPVLIDMKRKMKLRGVSTDKCLTYGLISTVFFWCMYVAMEHSSYQSRRHQGSEDSMQIVSIDRREILASNNSALKNVSDVKQDILIPQTTKITDMANPIVNVHEQYISRDIGIYNLRKFSGRVSSIYFVKVHKAGSTTIQNMLYRYGLNNDLPIALFNCPNGMPFPQTANKKYFFRDPFHATFNIMCDHASYDEGIYKQYMPKDTVTLGILRHPYEQLRSSIAFHGLVKPMRLNVKDPTSHFLTNPSTFDSRISFTGSSPRCGPTIRSSFTQNGMAYHFGYTHQKDNSQERISEFIIKMDNKMDFVMILERFDESLVLMKRMFHWKTQDILSLPLFSTTSFGKATLKKNRNDAAMEQLIDKHKHWSTTDYELYDHFRSKLDATIDAQPEDFHQEVQLYQLIKDKVRDHCKSMCSVGQVTELKTKRDTNEVRRILQSRSINIAASDWNQAFSINHTDCLSMTLGTLEYQAAVKTKQIAKNCSTAKNADNPSEKQEKQCSEDKANYLFYTFDWPKIQRQIFKDSSTCLKFFS